MRTSFIALVITAALGLISCSRETNTRRGEPAAREAGREAYHATQDLKRGAKRAAQELRKAGKEAHQGWEEAKRDEKTRRKE